MRRILGTTAFFQRKEFLMMHFHEGRRLNQAQYHDSDAGNPITSLGSQPQQFTCGRDSSHPFVHRTAPADWKTESALDSANNKLQELMQLLYLLGRDPRVPQDARHHVTVAQSEIALLTRLMQNSAEGNQSPGALPDTAVPPVRP